VWFASIACDHGAQTEIKHPPDEDKEESPSNAASDSG
jgi:hypothetical protein